MTVKMDDRAFRAALQRRIAGALDDEGARMASDAKAAVGRQNSGQPSAPGEPPARVTGRLQASIGHAVTTEGDDVVLTVGSGDPKAKLLELGTSTMRPRPYLRPTLDASLGRLRAALRQAFGRGS
jgi:hypothetical protein